jgi:hypothetical protein
VQRDLSRGGEFGNAWPHRGADDGDLGARQEERVELAVGDLAAADQQNALALQVESYGINRGSHRLAYFLISISRFLELARAWALAANARECPSPQSVAACLERR